MNMLSQLFGKRAIESLPPRVEGSLSAMSPEERATVLIYAVDYCLRLRRDSPGQGTLLSLKFLNPGELLLSECNTLYRGLEGVHHEMSSAKVSPAEYQAISSRHGKQVGDDYRKSVEVSSALNAAGLAILMTRLSNRIARLRKEVNELHEPPSPYTRIAALLREALPHIRAAAEKFNQESLVMTPERAWSNEAIENIDTNASLLAMTYPH